MISSILLLLAAAHVAPPAPEVKVTADNTVVTSSCTVVIPQGTVIEDADGNGVIQIKGDNITVEFAEGSVLRGAADGTPGNELKGEGIVIEGGRRVTIKNAPVMGFKIGIHGKKSSALTVEGCDFLDNFRQKLGSTPEAEDQNDWLYPHNNDGKEWSKTYGAALLVEDASQVTIRKVRCRRGQNGIMLDRVNDSKVYDNDCSFLSGWGLSMWRSSKNIVSRNSFDFCVRGHVEGVYNRGQDSAGILLFEQCSQNVFAENSVTHGGDCVFSFAGAEAIGEKQAPQGFVYGRKGCNDNIFIHNDLSYASAHGLELTFSYGNKIVENRFEENAICGVWGGYSQDTVIAKNHFGGNGGMAYGLERGAINMEHASDNKIFENQFINNKVAVHLWWDNDGQLLEKPGVKKSYKGVSGNVIAENKVVVNADHPFKNLPEGQALYAWQLRDAAEKQTDAKKTPGKKKEEHFKNNQISQNVVQIDGVKGEESAVDAGIEVKAEGPTPKLQLPKIEVLGESRPVKLVDGIPYSTRSNVEGRGAIVMDAWGPWDHASPMVRRTASRGASHVYELMGTGSQQVRVGLEPSSLLLQNEPAIGDRPVKITISGATAVQPYALTVSVGDTFSRVVKGTLMPGRWNVSFFTWNDASDPRNADGLAAWLKLAEESKAKATVTGELSFKYGGGGPGGLKLGKQVDEAGIGNDHFGTVATTRVNIGKGKWRIWTLSDDGVRVSVDGKNVIENWTYHGPTRNEAVYEQGADGQVDIRVEHFEIDGFSVLEVGVERVE